MPATTDSTRQSFGQYPNSSFEPPAALAERLDKMAPLQRSYVLNNLAIHLDEAADERSVHRLIRLAQEGFPRLKAERTLDVPQSSLDYRYYFRATLRARDLAGALHLARARRGLSHLTDWLASGVLAGLLPNLPSDSKLWEQIQRAVKALQP